VPCHAAGVEEDCDVGELVVVLDDVLQVDHGFAAFVAVEMKWRVHVVHNIDCFGGDIF